MTFEDAMIQYLMGKRVRLTIWATGLYISKYCDNLQNPLIGYSPAEMGVLKNGEWEIFEYPTKLQG